MGKFLLVAKKEIQHSREFTSASLPTQRYPCSEVRRIETGLRRNYECLYVNVENVVLPFCVNIIIVVLCGQNVVDNASQFEAFCNEYKQC